MVICDSLFEEKFWCERVFANLGRRLAERGFTVLSFDYYGYGNSGGKSEDVTVTGLEEDIGNACDFLRSQGIDGISLLAVRWGAALACKVASARDDIDSLFLVNPIGVWKSQLMKTLRANVAGQYAIFKKAVITREEIIEELRAGKDCVRAGYRMNNIDGYIFSIDFFEQASEVAVPVPLPGHIQSITAFTIPEGPTPVARRKDPSIAKLASAGTPIDDVFIEEDNAFWINNRIFTSTTPNFFREMEERLEALPEPRAENASAPKDLESDESCVIDGVTETAVTIRNDEGHDIQAVLYLPEESKKQSEGFIFTHGGLIGLNGAFRFNTRGARRLAKEGYTCLCCDSPGMGRSQGTIDNIEQRMMFRKICTGQFVPDVRNAARFLINKTGVNKIVLIGVCGGAGTNILAHSRCEEINGSVLLSVPVMLSSLDYDEVRMSEGYARFYLGMYVGKIFNPKAWWRFVTGKSETDKILKSLQVAVTGLLSKVASLFGGNREKVKVPEQPEQSEQKPDVPGEGDNLQFNKAFLEAYQKIVARKERMYFVFGEHDNFKWEFKTEFVKERADEYAAGEEYIDVEEIPHANHMYTLREWQDTIVDRCMEWIKNRKESGAPTG